MNKQYIVPFVIFIVGLCISVFYNFSTHFLTVCDASRDYALYNLYRLNPIWHPMYGLYGLELQNTSIITSYLPALIQWSTNLPAKIFFKLYLAFISAFVPVVAYFIAKKYVGNYAIFVSIFIIGWVSFYQGGSYARLNMAMIVYGLLLIVYLTRFKVKTKVRLLSILSLLLPIAHYGTALVAIGIFGGSLLWALIRKHKVMVIHTAIITVCLIMSFTVWHVIINKVTFIYLTQMVGDTTQMLSQGATDNVVLRTDQVIPTNDPASIMSRDRITQVALGVSDPDNAGIYKLNRWLFLFAWITVILTMYGVYKVVRGKYPIELKLLILLSLVSIALVVLIPQASRGYGIEKVYYQAIMVTGIALVIGGQSLAYKIHIPAWLLLVCVLIPYVCLMWKYGVIPSILG
jgi:uncharacterized membrane protein